MEPQLITSKTVSETLLPRRYQEEIFAKALKGNVIAALDTGSGKTFISTLLIKWIATRNFGQNKIIIFLVPKVALVEQQGDFISKQTPLRVKKIHGALAIDLSDRDGWKEQLSEVDVIVMTGKLPPVQVLPPFSVIQKLRYFLILSLIRIIAWIKFIVFFSAFLETYHNLITGFPFDL
jgi:hypothetical protein